MGSSSLKSDEFRTDSLADSSNFVQVALAFIENAVSRVTVVNGLTERIKLSVSDLP